MSMAMAVSTNGAGRFWENGLLTRGSIFCCAALSNTQTLIRLIQTCVQNKFSYGYIEPEP